MSHFTIRTRRYNIASDIWSGSLEKLDIIPRRFRLIPFPADTLPKIEITGHIERIENRLSIRYQVHGDAENILFPEASNPARKDNLWQATCFEFFLAMPGLPEYWEFNMSPSGEWNVYHMDAYRGVGFREEPSFSHLPFEFHKEDACLLDISIDLTSIIRLEQTLQIGISAVIRTKNGSETYWALRHPGEHADFHLRDGFLIGV
jgi:hypothetical protein